jgi:hypothetical protein
VWPKCGKATPYRYCSYHNGQIKYAGLCYFCRQKKENADHRLCSACFAAENEEKRRTAVAKGKCTNFWKCTNPASSQGGMCAQCFLEFSRKREAERQTKRQAAIDAGKCTNYWKCANPASCPGGMCTACFKEYKAKQAEKQPVVAVATVTIVKEVPKTVPKAVDFPPLPSSKGVKQQALHAWSPTVLTATIKAVLTAPPPPEVQQPIPEPKPKQVLAISAWGGRPEFVHDDGTAEWADRDSDGEWDQPEEVPEWDQPTEVAEWDRPDEEYDHLQARYWFEDGERVGAYVDDDEEAEYRLHKRR